MMHPARSVAVVVPARNAANHLPLQLAALSRQTHDGPWQVVVADNGSTDDTVAVAEAWRGTLPALTIVDAAAVPGPTVRGVHGPAHARNAGAASVKGDVDALAFCDADDVVDPDWLRCLVAGLERCAAVGGRLEYRRLNPPESVHWHDELQDDELPHISGFLPYAISASFAVRADAFWSVGGFDEGFVTGSDDIDLCWRLQQAGWQLGFVEGAVVHYRQRISVRGIARQGYGYGLAQPRLYRMHREQGFRWRRSDAIRTWRGLVRDVPRVLRRRRSARQWLRRLSFRIGRAVGSARERVLYL